MDKNMKTGFIIILILSALIIAVIFWKHHSKESSYYLYVQFQDAGTLQIDDPVIIQGVKAGRVNKISFLNSRILVSLQFPKSIMIPTKSEFKIATIGLMGERAIQINRSSSSEYFKENDTISGIANESFSVGEGLGKLAETITNPISISQKLDSIIILLNKQIELTKENRKQNK